MRLRARLGRAEGAAHKTFSSDRPPELTPAEWLEQFEAQGCEGAFAAEPDYPVALAAYREALDKAQAELGPGEERTARPAALRPVGADQQAELGPGEERTALLALCQGRYRHVEPRPPEVEAAWKWLAEMSLRRLHGIPPVTEAEYWELAAWFSENGARLERLALPARWFDMGGGRLTSASNVRHELARGPRAFGSGAAAEKVRRLKSFYGEGRS